MAKHRAVSDPFFRVRLHVIAMDSASLPRTMSRECLLIRQPPQQYFWSARIVLKATPHSGQVRL